MKIAVERAEVVQDLLRQGAGVLITPNHSTHADAFGMYEAADVVGTPFYFMATWHVFDKQGPVLQRVLQAHGVFSIDREASDLTAFKTAVEVLREKKNPLVIFPEGEVYHINDRVTPFREGAAAIAIAGARRAERPVFCVPCGMKFRYLDDPTADLLLLMDDLEQSIHWRPRREQTLGARIYAFGSAMMALKEIEFLGHAREGSLPDRTEFLAQHILGELERQHEVAPGENATIPERVKDIRSTVLTRLQDLEESDPKRDLLDRHLDEVFLVVQLFSYPGDYVSETPSVERLAETLDKFEEDVLGRFTATVRSRREASIRFGDPVEVVAKGEGKMSVRQLTDRLESEVQGLLDGLSKSAEQSP